MKLKRKLFGRILASLMLLAISLPCALNGQAQITYRGFVEGGLGMAIVSGSSGYNDVSGMDFEDGGKVSFSYMLATTHGIQLKNNFFGLGLGITPGYCDLLGEMKSKISIPLYANWRYDFFSSQNSLKPFVGIKGGAFIPISEFDLDEPVSVYGDGFPVYIALDFGLRKRLSESSGISFGLSVQTSNNSHVDYISNRYIDVADCLGIGILAKVTFDF